jgi:heat shock protein HtpX
MNQIKTVLLLGLLTGLLVVLGGAIGGRSGMVIALIIAAAMNFFSYWYSDKIVLKMYRARPASESEAPGVYGMVHELAMSAGLPTPKVYVVDDDTPNAFATGRNPQNAVVAVTSGILRTLSPRELRGVLGHELAHVKDRDILVSSVAATLAGAIMVLATMARWSMFFGGSSDDDEGGGLGIVGLLAMSILAPIGAMLVQMAVSRSREYLADKEGALMARDPEALASALSRLQEANQRKPMDHVQPQTAHLCIVSPLSGGSMANLFSTHPPMQERVARLMAMAGQGNYEPPPVQSSRGMAPPPPPPPPPPRAKQPGRGKIDWS